MIVCWNFGQPYSYFIICFPIYCLLLYTLLQSYLSFSIESFLNFFSYLSYVTAVKFKIF